MAPPDDVAGRPAMRPPVDALFPGVAERQRIESWLDAELNAIRPRLQAGPVVPDIDFEGFTTQLHAMDFARAMPLQEVLQWTLASLEHGIVQLNNPRYFGLFNPGPTFPAQCGERIANAFNPQLASSASSPVPVAIERHVIAALARRAGFGAEGTGHFATGGSEANFTALVCALTAGHADFAAEGVRAYGGAPRFYTSRDCHIAWLKIAHQAGLGRSALCLVDTDGCGKMDPQALRRAIDSDRAAGRVPVMVVATAGTTNAGMIDPLQGCADIAREHGMWYHVDAAWGGAALASTTMKPLLDGVERADSVTVDAHKWFATTMGCAMFVTRRGPTLSQAFHASAAFMPSSVEGIDPYLNSAQWSRRFLGLRLFVTLAVGGWDALGSHVERSVEVVQRVEERLLASGWTVVNASTLAVLNVLPPAGHGDVRALVRRVVQSGRAWVAASTFEGRDVVRICATNGETTTEDVDQLVAVLNASLEREPSGL